MGHIKRRTGKWQAAYRAPNGREKTKTFAKRVDAQRWINVGEAAIAKGDWVDPQAGRTKFDEYALSWLRTKNDVSDGTKANVRGRLEKYAIPAFGPTQISGIKAKDIREFQSELLEKELAPATVKSILMTVSAVFRQAVEDGMIGTNPCTFVKGPRLARDHEMMFLNPAQVSSLAEAHDLRYRAAIFVGAYAGLRAGEIWALRTDRVDLVSRTIQVVDSVRDAQGRLVFGPTKTNRPRAVVIPEFLAEMLRVHIAEHPTTSVLVFSAHEGGPVRHNNFRRRHFEKARQAIGLPDLRFHDLRHTCAAMLIKAGRHMEEVKTHLGHSSIRVTSDNYGHLFPTAFPAIASCLEEAYQGDPDEADSTRNLIA